MLQAKSGLLQAVAGFVAALFVLAFRSIHWCNALTVGTIQRLALLFVVPLLCVSCATTEFQQWEGRNSVVEGHGGTKKVVDGMDVWTFGEPPRRFQILGIIQDERPGGRLHVAQLSHDIVQKARQSGGNAVILVSSESQLRGYYSTGSATAYNYGGYGTAYGSGITIPITRRTSTFVVIKYLD